MCYRVTEKCNVTTAMRYSNCYIVTQHWSSHVYKYTNVTSEESEAKH